MTPLGPPGPPRGPRDPGDAWVELPTGERFWGRFGAAGLLALDPRRGVLLQHRVEWSHFGGTWGLPGGARHLGESAMAGALREAGEEAGVPVGAVRPRFESVLDRQVWSYTTVVGDVVTPFEPVIGDRESRELAWVPVDEVASLDLHPGLAASWPRLHAELGIRPVVLVDAANVVGSVPDGWWRDRAGATSRLLRSLAEWAALGVAGPVLALPEDRWFPPVVAVIEGQARAVADSAGVTIVRADAGGDDRIVAEASRLVAEGFTVTAVTSDRGLADRLTPLGATVHGAGWLRSQLPTA